MNGKPTYKRRGFRGLAAASATSLALVAAIASGVAQAAPPMKNAERRCVNAGGTFSMTATSYTCTGVTTAAVEDSARRHCLNAYKGYAFNWGGTGPWQYSCYWS
jgi:hypothetical protein